MKLPIDKTVNAEPLTPLLSFDAFDVFAQVTLAQLGLSPSGIGLNGSWPKWHWPNWVLSQVTLA